MKKTLALVLALTLLLASVSALALSPQVPEVLKKAVAGQTFMATCRGYQSIGDNVSVYVLLYEYARYSQADIDALVSEGEAEAEADSIKVTDYIDADVGSGMIYSVTPVEDGYILNGQDPNAEAIYLSPDGEGGFFAKDAEGNFFLKEALELTCPIAEDAQFIDATGDAPVEHTAQELIDAIQDDRDDFENIEVTFNDDGEIAVLKVNPAE